MPTLLRWAGWRFHFYSADRFEPPHVHVSKGRQELKIWLGDLSVARVTRCTDREIADILYIARQHRAMFLERWDEHCGD